MKREFVSVKSPSIKDALSGNIGGNNQSDSDESVQTEYEKPKTYSSYSDKLKNPLWQRKRLEILQLRGFKCEQCSCETKELHVHHRFYIKGRQVWEYDNDVFQVLCCDCHENEHNNKHIKQVNIIPKKYTELINVIESSKEKFAFEKISQIVSELVDSKNIENMSFAFNDAAILDIIFKQAEYCKLTEIYCIKTSLQLQELKSNKNGEG